MEYTPAEQKVLSLMKRADFKNISKNDVFLELNSTTD